ncbi:hypothetical protein [Treponema pedis]|uniref:Uncharacterized protein n=1 Tax=Treponema pedis str. T A4 TaxID=1291379 RepID=S5ZSY7_9SPIR|nr:hypothetical protein [Treponema pedis]AGT43230.1 hypothetical protein TPE_0734 [Treponema pedis str. T A4]
MVASSFDDNLIPQTIKDAAFYGIPKFIASDNAEDLASSALQIAKAFDRKDFFDCTEQCNPQVEKKLIESFMKNIQLLAQKTWVEKTDEEFKEETIYRINILCEKFLAASTKSVYKEMFTEYFSILHDVILLLFGSMVKTGDFLKYALRIDPDFGFFWYYVDNISKISNVSEEKARCSVLLAMFFLANF